MEDTKVKIKGINELLNKYSGKDATIRISHKLFGMQKIKTELDYIFDEDRIGFRVGNGQEIFIYIKDLVEFGIGGSIYFADDVMKLEIKLNEQ